MKIEVTLKDPDGFSTSVDQAIIDSVNAQQDLDEDEKDVIEHRRAKVCRAKVWKALDKFVSYQEYVTIDFDTETGTATVRETGR